LRASYGRVRLCVEGSLPVGLLHSEVFRDSLVLVVMLQGRALSVGESSRLVPLWMLLVLIRLAVVYEKLL
jgi:hypothetical protein